MSKDRSGGNAPSIHVEWAPGQVLAVDIANGRRRSAATLSELSSFFSGQKNILVGISRQHTFLKAVALPKAAPEDLRRILAIQLGQHFPLPADQLAFDFVQTNVRADDGFVTMLAAVRSEDLRKLLDELKSAGVKAARILPVALGSIGVAAHAQTAVALVASEAAGGGFALDVVSDGVVRISRTVLAEGTDMVREVQRTLAAAGTSGDMMLIAAGSSDSGSREALGRLTDAHTEARGSLEMLHEAPPTFAFELAEQRELEHRKRIGDHTRLAVFLLVASLILVGVFWDTYSRAATKVASDQSAWTTVMNKEKATNSTETAKAQSAHDEADTLKAAFQVAQPIGDVASMVGDCLPPKSSWLTGLDVQRGKIIDIRGTTTVPDDVATILKALGDSGRFRDVKLVVANSGKISSQPVVQFGISAFPIGNLPMPVPAAKKPGAKPVVSTEGGTTQ